MEQRLQRQGPSPNPDTATDRNTCMFTPRDQDPTPTPTRGQSCYNGRDTKHKQKPEGARETALSSPDQVHGVPGRPCTEEPLPAVGEGSRDGTPGGRRLPQALKASSAPWGLSQMHGTGQSRPSAHRHPRRLVQEELQRSGGWAACRGPAPPHPGTYLLSARSVLLPTSMMMTSLPLSVLTSSIHLEVCWKELRSGRSKWG